MKLNTHPYADLFPMFGEAELAKLTEDIRQHGQLMPAIIDQHGRLVDGRNRKAACDLLGIAVRTEQRHFDTDRDVLSFILSLNDVRRHLTESQRSMIAAEIANMGEGGDKRSNQYHSANLQSDVSQAEAAEMLNVSTRSVASAAKVLGSNGTPELQQAVRDGDIKVSRAAGLAALPADQQRAEVVTAKGKTGSKRSGNNGQARAKTGGKAKGQTKFAELIRWAARRKKFTIKEMADACDSHVESCRRDLNSAVASKGYLAERLDDNEYRVRKAVHFVPVDAIAEGEVVGLMEILKELYEEALRARKLDGDMNTSANWEWKDRLAFLNKFIGKVGQLIK